MSGQVTAVSRSRSHGFSKRLEFNIRLVAGHGVEGDAHCGEKVKHRSRVRANPDQPNLRQVHLIHAELHEELRAAGFRVGPGDMGENITTQGVDLLALPQGARLRIGRDVVLQVTGLRNPCIQLDRFQDGLMKAVLDRAQDGTLIRKAGIMSIVETGGELYVGDAIVVELPAGPQRPLLPV
jgi:MOSC domain-containing protein YiiM